MAETMKDYEAELEASFKKIEEGDILTGTVVSVDDKEIIVDLKYYAEGIIPVEDYKMCIRDRFFTYSHPLRRIRRISS